MVGFSFSYQILVWLKNSFGKDTLFLKHFHFCISFINCLTNICVYQVILKIRALNQEKIPHQHHSKIPDQEFKSWSSKYLKLIIKNKSW